MKKPVSKPRSTKSEVDARLKAAFQSVEAKGAPEPLVDVVDALAGSLKPRRDARN